MRWSDDNTKLVHELLLQGYSFHLVGQIFPDMTRTQIENKFKGTRKGLLADELLIHKAMREIRKTKGIPGAFSIKAAEAVFEEVKKNLSLNVILIVENQLFKDNAALRVANLSIDPRESRALPGLASIADIEVKRKAAVLNEEQRVERKRKRKLADIE